VTVSLPCTLQSFFGLPAQRPPTPSGGDTSQGQGSQMEGGSHKDSGKEATRLWALASGPTQKQVHVQFCLDCLLPLLPLLQSTITSHANGALP